MDDFQVIAMDALQVCFELSACNLCSVVRAFVLQAASQKRHAEVATLLKEYARANDVQPAAMGMQDLIVFMMKTAEVVATGDISQKQVCSFFMITDWSICESCIFPSRLCQVNLWIKLRGGIGAYYCNLGMNNPISHPIVTKFYKGLRKRANLKAPRGVRRTPIVNPELLSKTCIANMEVRGRVRSVNLEWRILTLFFLIYSVGRDLRRGISILTCFIASRDTLLTATLVPLDVVV
jgi:hypothetical protein